MHPFMALWIMALITPAMAQRMLFDPSLAQDLERISAPRVR